MKNEKRQKYYITNLSNHLSLLGYPTKVCGEDNSHYTNVGDTQIRIATHIGFNPHVVSIIISMYTSEIIVIMNSLPTIYKSLKDVKTFLTNFVFVQETLYVQSLARDSRLGLLKSKADTATHQLSCALEQNKQLEKQIKELQTQVNEQAKELDKKIISNIKTNNTSITIDYSKVTPKGVTKINNIIKQLNQCIKGNSK